MLDKLLRLKHWQLFILLVGLPLLIQISVISYAVASRDLTPMLVLIPMASLLFVAIFLAWFYALGTKLHTKLPSTVSMNLKRFKLFLMIPVLYIPLLFALIAFGMDDWLPAVISGNGFPVIFILLHLFSAFCMFYCMYFIAKELKATELQRPVSFNDFAGEFFLIWFFPIGVWFLQPRINRLFRSSQEQ